MNEIVFHIKSIEDTERLGGLLAKQLQPKDVVGLCGDLGAGKTFLAGCIARALDVPENVPLTSPTFTLIKEYRHGRIPIYHMDLYRLGDAADLYELGLWEYYDGDGVCLVEWSNLFEDLWPDHALILHIALGEGECRTITASGNTRGGIIARALKSQWER
jgi:tRNA threonylcarbamoyladenosine biosynthesis protein TsaE